MDFPIPGVDYSFKPIPARAIAESGAKFVVRYLGGSASLTPIERDNLHRNDLPILLVMEQEADAAEKGFQRGVEMAIAANHQADNLGYPAECPIFYADDKNDVIVDEEVAFMQGVRSVGGRTPDMYSGWNVLAELQRRGITPFGGWAVETWFRNSPFVSDANPCMIQLANTRDPIHIDDIDDDNFDTNLLYKKIPAWGPNGVVMLGGTTPTTTPIEKHWRGKSMYVIVIMGVNADLSITCTGQSYLMSPNDKLLHDLGNEGLVDLLGVKLPVNIALYTNPASNTCLPCAFISADDATRVGIHG